MKPDDFVNSFVRPGLVRAGFKRSGKNRFVLRGEHVVVIDLDFRGSSGERIVLYVSWFVVPRVWEEYHRGLGEKRLSRYWAIFVGDLFPPGSITRSFELYDEASIDEWGRSLSRQIEHALIPEIVPLIDGDGLESWIRVNSHLEGSEDRAVEARVVSRMDAVSVEEARALVSAYAGTMFGKYYAAKTEFLRARVEARAAIEAASPADMGSAPSLVQVELNGDDPVAAVLSGPWTDLGAYGSVLVCRVVPGLAVLGEDADDLGSVTSLGGSWVMARYPFSTIAGDGYDLIESVAVRTGAPVLMGMVFGDLAVDVTGFGGRSGFWRMLLPVGLDDSTRAHVLKGQPSRGRIDGVEQRVVAVSAWAEEGGISVDEQILRVALTMPADEDDPVAADSALDALLAAVGLVHHDPNDESRHSGSQGS